MTRTAVAKAMSKKRDTRRSTTHRDGFPWPRPAPEKTDTPRAWDRAGAEAGTLVQHCCTTRGHAHHDARCRWYTATKRPERSMLIADVLVPQAYLAQLGNLPMTLVRARAFIARRPRASAAPQLSPRLRALRARH